MQQLFDVKRSNLKEDHITKKVEVLAMFQTQIDEVDLAIKFLRKSLPHLVEGTIEKYISLLEEKISTAAQSIDVFPTETFNSEKWGCLSDFPQIFAPLQKAMLSFLGVGNLTSLKTSEPLIDEIHTNTTLEVPYQNFIQFSYYHLYYLFYALELIENRDTAHDIGKKFGEYIYGRPNPNKKTFDTLEDYRNHTAPLTRKTHNTVSGITQEGNFILRVDGCIFGESLRDVEDPNLMFYLICYGDYFSAKKANENFRLTRNYTIVQGQSMCDFCYHDIRKTPHLRHPDEAFWKTI